jgi:hypothetical protein
MREIGELEDFEKSLAVEAVGIGLAVCGRQSPRHQNDARSRLDLLG